MKSICLTLLACAGTVVTASANLVQNGSFESGNYINGLGGYTDRMSLFSGSTDITSWTVGHDGGWSFVWWMSRPSFNAIDGDRALSLDGNEPNYAAWVEQSIPTEIGKTYRVSFSYSSDANGGPSHTQVLIDGNLIGEVNHGSGTGGPEPAYDYLDWDRASFDFTATGTSSLLRFYDATLGNYNTILDDVSVLAVPESLSTLLAAAGGTVCVLSAVSRSRRRQTE